VTATDVLLAILWGALMAFAASDWGWRFRCWLWGYDSDAEDREMLIALWRRARSWFRRR